MDGEHDQGPLIMDEEHDQGSEDLIQIKDLYNNGSNVPSFLSSGALPYDYYKSSLDKSFSSGLKPDESLLRTGLRSPSGTRTSHQPDTKPDQASIRTGIQSLTGTPRSYQPDTGKCSTHNTVKSSDDLDSNAASTSTSGPFNKSSGSKPFRTSGSNGVRPFKYKTPPLISYTFSTPDEEKSKTNDDRNLADNFDRHAQISDFSTQSMNLKTDDARYLRGSCFYPPGQITKENMSSWTNGSDEKYHHEGNPQNVKQPKDEPPPACSPISTSSDEVATYDRAQSDAAEDEYTTESSSQSIDSDESGSVSSADDEKLTIAYTKHQIIISLMRDFYTMFSSQWQAYVRTHTTPEAESSRVFSNPCESADSPTQNRLGKRANFERDRSQGDGNDGKRKRNNPPDTTTCEPDLQLACPFHKHDPIKYCPNIDTGVKYRTCLGPGFRSISRLKQHLRRTHDAPKQCRRCWLVYKNREEEDRHVNADIRCEARPIQIEEGISEEKMLLIQSRRGATWENIFSILFPGATIPSPYLESSPLASQTAQSFSSQSSDLRNFEAYNRTTLPLLVEASLRAVVDLEVAPIEERLRTLVVDIVRNCQATVAQNFETLNNQSATTGVPRQTFSHETNLPQIDEEESSVREEGSGEGADTRGPNFFVEPPHLNEDMITSVPVASNYPPNEDTTLARTSDSGYGSNANSCGCPCHLTSGLSSTLYDRMCAMCSANHFDPWFPDVADLADF